MLVREYLLNNGLPAGYDKPSFELRLLPLIQGLRYVDTEFWGHNGDANREAVLAAVSENGSALAYASAALRADEGAVLAAVRQMGLSLYCASKELQANSAVVLAAVRNNGLALADASPDLRANKEVVLAAVRQDGSAIAFASNALKADKEVVLAALEKGCCTPANASVELLDAWMPGALDVMNWRFSALVYAPMNFRANKALVLAAVTKDGRALREAVPALRANREIVLSAVEQDGGALAFATIELRADREIVLAAARAGSKVGYVCGLAWAVDELRADPEVVLAAVKQSGAALKYAPPDLRAKKEVVLEAVSTDGSALAFALGYLRSNKEVVLAAVQQSGVALEYADPALQADREVVLAAVRQDGSALAFASDVLKADKEVVLAAVQADGVGALSWAALALQADREVVLTAMQQDIDALGDASTNLLADPEFVLAAVSERGAALGYVAVNFTEERKYVLAAVKQSGVALEKASINLQADMGVVLDAVKQNGKALRYASTNLQADKGVVLVAVKQNGKALEFASDVLRADREVVLSAVINARATGALRHAAAALKTDPLIVYEASLTELMLHLKWSARWATLEDGRLVWAPQSSGMPAEVCSCDVRLLLLLHAIQRERHDLTRRLIARQSVYALTTETTEEGDAQIHKHKRILKALKEHDVEQKYIHASILKASEKHKGESMLASIIEALNISPTFKTDLELYRSVHKFTRDLAQKPNSDRIVQDDSPLLLELLLDKVIKTFTVYAHEHVQIHNNVLKRLEKTKEKLIFYKDQLVVKPKPGTGEDYEKQRWQYYTLVPKIRALTGETGVISKIIDNQIFPKPTPPDQGHGEMIIALSEQIEEFDTVITRIFSPNTSVGGDKQVQSRLSLYWTSGHGTKRSAQEARLDDGSSPAKHARHGGTEKS